MEQEDKELIVAALAFASSSDVIANFTPKQEQRLCELAVELREEYEIEMIEMVELPYKSAGEVERYSDDKEKISKYLEFISTS